VSAIAISPLSFLKLFCYVKGKHYNHTYPVEIGKEKWVTDLKDSIKERAGQTFHNVSCPVESFHSS
jgi:hypothetical protein